MGHCCARNDLGLGIEKLDAAFSFGNNNVLFAVGGSQSEALNFVNLCGRPRAPHMHCCRYLVGLESLGHIIDRFENSAARHDQDLTRGYLHAQVFGNICGQKSCLSNKN